jgi:hypothetical protein
MSDDRNGRRASRVAQKFNKQFQSYWRSLAHGLHKSQISRYVAARQRGGSIYAASSKTSIINVNSQRSEAEREGRTP